MRVDPALYLFLSDGFLQKLSGYYVDEILRASHLGIRKHYSITNYTFDMTEESSLPSEFTGFLIACNKENNLIIDQTVYIRHLECLPNDDTSSHFRSMRMHTAC